MDEKKKKKVRGRGPVVHLNRKIKALMIEAFLIEATGEPISGKKILDIGSGNGEISEYFAYNNTQYSVDVQDLRRNKKSKANFFLVTSEKLPFEENFFDIVISSHVIEHVSDQAEHLKEIHRVLKPNGIGYIGTPNKTSPIMEGHVGNDKVLHFKEMTSLFSSHGFMPEPLSVKLMKQPFKYHCEIKAGRFFPGWVLKLLQPLFPSQSFLLKPHKE